MKKIKIGVVGPCAAGKTTLIAGLKQHGYLAKHIAQEHSYVSDMWRRLANPDVLIYLDVSYLTTRLRKKINWSLNEFEEQVNRLQDARKNADYYLDTDKLTPEEVLEGVLSYLNTITQQTGLGNG